MGGMVGPNGYGVPENYPLIPADAGCKKCHGTGYKKAMLTRKYKVCGHCAKKYGTDKHSINLHDLPPLSHQGVAGVSGVGTT